MTGYITPPLIIGVHYSHEGHRESIPQFLQRREPVGAHGIFLLLGNTVCCLHPHHVVIYIEGCPRSKGGVCIIPYICKQLKISLDVYIWKKNITNRDLLEVMCDPTGIDQFCSLPAMLFFSVSLLSMVEGKINKANI